MSSERGLPDLLYQLINYSKSDLQAPQRHGGAGTMGCSFTSNASCPSVTFKMIVALDD